MQEPKGRHYNVLFEPSQASNNYTGPFVIGYLYLDGPFGRREQKYKVPTQEGYYRRLMRDAKKTKEPWTWAYEQFRPLGAEKSTCDCHHVPEDHWRRN